MDDFVGARKAALLCVGSRHLTLGERLLITSMGSELAAVAPCPVAVVPP
jgi:nucleotide-binding universal stress UspA family protein